VLYATFFGGRLLVEPWDYALVVIDTQAVRPSRRPGRRCLGSPVYSTATTALPIDEIERIQIRVVETGRVLLEVRQGHEARRGSMIKYRDIVQRVVDFPGPQNPSPGTPVIKALPASAFAGSTAAVRVDTNWSSFVRTQVKDSTGTVIALWNPVWLLREYPPGEEPFPPLAPAETVIGPRGNMGPRRQHVTGDRDGRVGLYAGFCPRVPCGDPVGRSSILA